MPFRRQLLVATGLFLVMGTPHIAAPDGIAPSIGSPVASLASQSSGPDGIAAEGNQEPSGSGRAHSNADEGLTPTPTASSLPAAYSADDLNRVWAVVNGREITGNEAIGDGKPDLKEKEDQVSQAESPEERDSAMRELYGFEISMLCEKIEQIVLEQAANANHTTIDHLFSQFDHLRSDPVTKSEIDNFLQEYNANWKHLSASQRKKVPDFVGSERFQNAATAYVDDLITSATINISIQPPVESRTNVAVGRGTAWGSS